MNVITGAQEVLCSVIDLASHNCVAFSRRRRTILGAFVRSPLEVPFPCGIELVCAALRCRHSGRSEPTRVIISHTYKFIFFRTQRVAGSSVEAALSHICGGDDILTPAGEQVQGQHKNRDGSNFKIPLNHREPGWRLREFLWNIPPIRKKFFLRRLDYSKVDYWSHIPARHVKATIDKQMWNTYYKVSIERNPWDREVSYYSYKYSKRTGKRPSFRQYAFRSAPSPNFSIYSIDGKVVVDQLMRYESLREDFGRFMEHIGAKADIHIPRTNASDRKDGRDYRSNYDDELIRLIANRYQPEIEYCGYSF